MPKTCDSGQLQDSPETSWFAVWPDQDREERLLAPSGRGGKKDPNGPVLHCEEGVQAASLVSPL